MPCLVHCISFAISPLDTKQRSPSPAACTEISVLWFVGARREPNKSCFLMEATGYCAKLRMSCSVVHIEELGEKV